MRKQVGLVLMGLPRSLRKDNVEQDARLDLAE